MLPWFLHGLVFSLPPHLFLCLMDGHAEGCTIMVAMMVACVAHYYAFLWEGFTIASRFILILRL